MTAEGFCKWWLEEHVPAAKAVPGMKKYVCNLAVGAWNEEPQYDGVTEIWFDTMNDVHKAFESPLMKTFREDIKKKNITVTRIFAEEYVILQ